MIDIVKQVITEKGVYILLAVVGFISGITTLFIDVNSEISIKWFLFLISISIIILILFFSILNKIIWEKQIVSVLKIIKYQKDKKTIVLKTNQDISINSLLTIYVDNDGYEELCFLCYVENVQDNKLLSVKIIETFSTDISDDLVKKGIVKTTLPFGILGDLNG